MRKPSPYSCGKCGYTLTGLPPLGVCPECGNRYNQNSGDGVTMRPHEIHVVPDRVNLIFRIGFHCVSITILWLFAYACVRIHVPWLAVAFAFGATAPILKIVECLQELRKLKSPL